MKVLVEVLLRNGRVSSWSAQTPSHRFVCEDGFIAHIRWRFDRTNRDDPNSGVGRLLRGEGRQVIFQNEPEAVKTCYVLYRVENNLEIVELVGDLELFPEFSSH